MGCSKKSSRSYFIQHSTTMPHFLHDHASSSTTPASVPKATKKFITRIFLTIPANTQWSSSVPSIAHWPTELSHVLVSLEDSMRWAGVTFPQPFPPNSVEFHVAKAFGSHFQHQTHEFGISGSFFKRTKKRNGVGQDRAYKLEPYVQEAGAVYGKLIANSIILYMPASQTLPPTLVPTF